MFNSVMLVGNVVDDVVLNKTKDGKDMTFVTLEVPRPAYGGNTPALADVFKIAVFGYDASNLLRDGVKNGSVIGINGRLSTRSFEKNDGSIGYNHQIDVDNITLLQKEGVVEVGVNIIEVDGNVTSAIEEVMENNKSVGLLNLNVDRFYKSNDSHASTSDDIVLYLRGKIYDEAQNDVFAGMRINVKGKLNGTSHYSNNSHDKFYNIGVYIKDLISYEINSLSNDIER